jgi:hypothetical protein
MVEERAEQRLFLRWENIKRDFKGSSSQGFTHLRMPFSMLKLLAASGMQVGPQPAGPAWVKGCEAAAEAHPVRPG